MWRLLWNDIKLSWVLIIIIINSNRSITTISTATTAITTTWYLLMAKWVTGMRKWFNSLVPSRKNAVYLYSISVYVDLSVYLWTKETLMRMLFDDIRSGEDCKTKKRTCRRCWDKERSGVVVELPPISLFSWSSWNEISPSRFFSSPIAAEHQSQYGLTWRLSEL